MKIKKGLKVLPKDKYDDLIVKPAERLLAALLETEKKEHGTKVRKTAIAIHR